MLPETPRCPHPPTRNRQRPPRAQGVAAVLVAVATSWPGGTAQCSPFMGTRQRKHKQIQAPDAYDVRVPQGAQNVLRSLARTRRNVDMPKASEKNSTSG